MRKIAFILILFNLLAQAQTKVEVIGAEKSIYDQKKGDYFLCLGNVKFKQGEMYMDCDSARFYERENRVEAFGNIYIRKKDSLDLWGDYLEYNGDSRLAVVKRNVRLTDGEMTLKTQRLNYNMAKREGYYTTGGDITNGKDKLRSKRGLYNANLKTFYFKDSVRLINEEYTMNSDTLHYNTESKLASFYGPTTIVSDSNTIYCQYGWYNTETETSQFSKGAYIQTDKNRLDADSMLYDRNNGIGKAFGNISLVDSVDQIHVTGQFGEYNENNGTTLITGSAKAFLVEDDTFFLKSDTFINIENDTARLLLALSNCELFRSDFQGICDSLVYRFEDSTTTLFKDPVMWTGESQISADTLIVFRNENGIDRLLARNNGFVIERDTNGLFNQIKGKNLKAMFSNGAIDKVYVKENGESIYYAREYGRQYSGVNEIVCGHMRIDIDSVSRVQTITFYSQPQAIFHPIEDFPQNKSELSGFDWRYEDKPVRSSF